MSFAATVKQIFRFVLLLLLNSQAVTTFAQSEMLLADFTSGWRNDWEVKLLHRRPNRFDVTSVNGNKVLRVYSSTSASGMFRKWEVDPLTSGSITSSNSKSG